MPLPAVDLTILNKTMQKVRKNHPICNLPLTRGETTQEFSDKILFVDLLLEIYQHIFSQLVQFVKGIATRDRGEIKQKFEIFVNQQVSVALDSIQIKRTDLISGQESFLDFSPTLRKNLTAEIKKYILLTEKGVETKFVELQRDHAEYLNYKTQLNLSQEFRQKLPHHPFWRDPDTYAAAFCKALDQNPKDCAVPVSCLDAALAFVYYLSCDYPKFSQLHRIEIALSGPAEGPEQSEDAHCFVVIDRPQECGPRELGDSTFICCPWYNASFYASELDQSLVQFPLLHQGGFWFGASPMKPSAKPENERVIGMLATVFAHAKEISAATTAASIACMAYQAWSSSEP